MNARAVAAKVIRDVVGSTMPLDAALQQNIGLLKSPADQALVQELSYGVLRWWFRLQEIAQGLLQKPMKPKDLDVFCLLLVGLYQLQYTRIPPHAAVSETVTAVRQLKKAWADKLLNAILRRQLREAEQKAEHKTDNSAFSPEARWAHAAWLLQELQAAWPQHWQAIVEANNQRPPMTLRVNRQKITRDAYLDRLRERGMDAKAAQYAGVGIVLEQAVNVEKLPGFAQGLVSVQDSAAQLAAPLMQLHAGQRVLDVCAAPGGKTAHLLELSDRAAQVVALDIDAQRLARVEQNLQRLGLSATLICGDAADPASWWDGAAFDRILLDAPCSATGVIRRHPDIKVLRQPQDVQRVSERQQRLLDAVWPLLKPGGMLIYATCSVLPVENEIQVARFIERNQNACYQRLEVPWGHDRPNGRQIFPGEQDMDGFYYASITKRD
jgi:16S rRNA (cytosine967-C5)-methyltransferase